MYVRPVLRLFRRIACSAVCMCAFAFRQPADIGVCSFIALFRMFMRFRAHQRVRLLYTALFVHMPGGFFQFTYQFLLRLSVLRRSFFRIAIFANQPQFVTRIAMLMFLQATISSLLHRDSRQN